MGLAYLAMLYWVWHTWFPLLTSHLPPIQRYCLSELSGQRQPDGQAGGLWDDPRHVRERLLQVQPER